MLSICFKSHKTLLFYLHSQFSFRFTHLIMAFFGILSFLQQVTFQLISFSFYQMNKIIFFLKVCWQQILSVFSDNVFISSSFLKRIFAGYRILCWSLFSFSILIVYFYCPLFCLVAKSELSVYVRLFGDMLSFLFKSSYFIFFSFLILQFQYMSRCRFLKFFILIRNHH